MARVFSLSIETWNHVPHAFVSSFARQKLFLALGCSIIARHLWFFDFEKWMRSRHLVLVVEESIWCRIIEKERGFVFAAFINDINDANVTFAEKDETVHRPTKDVDSSPSCFSFQTKGFGDKLFAELRSCSRGHCCVTTNYSDDIHPTERFDVSQLWYNNAY